MALAHAVVLFAHSYLRWLVLGLALLVVARSWLGWRRQLPWQRRDEYAHASFNWAVRVQFLLGMLLYLLLSPLTQAFFSDVRASLKVSELRFFGLEHVVMMVIAVAVADAGRAHSRRIGDARLRHRGVFITTALPLVLMLAAVPWPFMPASRPLMRSSDGIQWVARGDVGDLGCPSSYAARCAACHGPRGRGDGVLASSLEPRPQSFAEPGWAAGADSERLRGVIREGGAAYGLSPLMPPHLDLQDSELEALARCVRSFGVPR